MRALLERAKGWWPLIAVVLAAFGITVAVNSGDGVTTIKVVAPHRGAVPVPKTLAPKPGCSPAGGEGAAGLCAPAPSAELKAARAVLEHPERVPAKVRRTLRKAAIVTPLIAAQSTGPDLSNNNPVVSGQAAIRRHGHRYEYVKVNQGTGFVDRWAAPMTSAAHRADIRVGGYDFLEVCLVSPVQEADLFVARYRAIGFDLPPVGDVEFGGCRTAQGSRDWLDAWGRRVHDKLGQWPGLYTGAWWWNPHMGCWWPSWARFAWISGYGVPRPFMPCGRSQLDLWQFTDRGFNGANTGDMNRLYTPTVFGGARQAPAEAFHQCRMHRHYAGWFRQYTRRQLERGHEHPPRVLDALGAARLKSSTDHLVRIRHYFVKDHEHGRANYDCHPDGTVTVRVVKPKARSPKPRPRPRARPAHTSVDLPFRIVGGRAPAPALIAPYIDIVTDGATVNSIYRGEDAASILHAHGLHTQAEVFDLYGPGIANPAGRSTHELRCDGIAYGCSPVGGHLATWQVGFDVNDADVPAVIRHAHKLGWIVFQPYPGSRVEFHHLNFLARPSARGELRDKVRARRERLPAR